MTGEPTPAVSVIMPTLARSARAPLLRRALRSVLDQDGVRPIPIVVLNGPQPDPELAAELRSRRDLRLVQLDQADLPAALRAGRAVVDTSWFAELDDDDLLLPEAFVRRLAFASAHPGCDAVVSNGIARGSAGDAPILSDVHGIRRDPFGALAQRTWLSPGGALFRTDAIGLALFDGMPRFLEWTYLALRIARGHQLAFLDEPTFVHHPGRPDSLWASPSCTRALPEALERILGLELPAPLHRSFAARRASAFHAAADEALQRGALGEAWGAPQRSRRGPAGWGYPR
jgi:glycosyltransferase involved in cell wall biosynthesis